MTTVDRIGNALHKDDLVLVKVQEPDRLFGRIVSITPGEEEKGITEMVIAIPITLQKRADPEVIFHECLKIFDPEKAAYAEELVRHAQHAEPN